MDHAPTTAADGTTAADTCQCRPAGCPHCGAGQKSEMALRQMRNLAEIGELGMDLARQIHRQMQGMGVLGFQGARMFDQVTRAVRRAHALEAKIAAESRKTDAQRAAEQASRDAAIERAMQRAEQPNQAVQPATAPPAESSDARERRNLLNDLRDRDDLFDDLDDLDDPDDLDDGLDDEDVDDERVATSVDAAIGDLYRDLDAARKLYRAAAETCAGAGKAAAVEPAAPEPASVADTVARRAADIVSGGRLNPSSGLTPIPAALAWPPPVGAGHDPPR
jgi:hypothetical protein